MINFGEVPAGSTLPIFFSSYGKTNGESITLTGLAVTDIEIYKNGSTTQRASDSGYTLLDTDGIDFDGITGIHGFSIDLSDNADSGFYAVGSFYCVVVSAVTIDGQTVNFIAATFRIKAAEATAGYPAVTVKPGTGTGEINVASGVVPANVTQWSGTNVASPDTAGYPKVTIKNGTGTGELSFSSGQMLVQSGTSSGQLSVASGVIAANMTQIGGTAQSATDLKDFADTGYDPSTHKVQGVVLTDTVTTYTGNTPQTGDSYARIGSNGASLTALATASALSAAQGNITSILADTNELQTDWADGGRLDLLLDGASSAGDPWTTTLPGSYTSGQAGHIIGTLIDAAISSRLASGSYTAPLSAADTRTALGLSSANLDSQLGDILSGVNTVDGNVVTIVNAVDTEVGTANTNISALITTIGVAGAGLTGIPRTGYKLSSDGLDSVSTAAPSGVASNFREMMVALWRGVFKKSDLNANTGELKHYADNGSTVLTTQTCTDDGTTQTRGAAT